MRDLLRGNERRQLETVETLVAHDDWMTISDLAKAVNSSPRILKYDFIAMKENYREFTIETSIKGIRLVFKKNKGLKSHYKQVFANSTSFKLLELIFFNADYTVYELADELFLSISSLYRLINNINEVTKKSGFHIETNPCRLVGNEKNIRFFFYCYFYEKYTNLDWSIIEKHSNLSIVVIDNFLSFFIDLVKLNLDFAYYNQFKVMVFINMVRYKEGHLIDVDYSRINFKEFVPDLEVYWQALEYFEKHIRVKVDMELLAQIFIPFVDDRYSVNYDTLSAKIETKTAIRDEVTYIKSFLNYLADKNELPLNNISNIVYHIHNAVYFEGFDPKAGHILYDRNAHFMETLKEEFPLFYKDLYTVVKKYREVSGLEHSQEGMNYFMYIIFSHWDYLLLELRKKYEKVKILVISNRDVSHSNMLKDFIEYEFGQRLVIDIFDGTYLTETILENLDYDFIISNFPLPLLKSKSTIYVENIPTLRDFEKIGVEINDVLMEKNYPLED